MYMTAVFDSRISISFCRRHLGRVATFSNEKIKRELGMDFISVEDSIVATVEGLLAMGAVPRKE